MFNNRYIKAQKAAYGKNISGIIKKDDYMSLTISVTQGMKDNLRLSDAEIGWRNFRVAESCWGIIGGRGCSKWVSAFFAKICSVTFMDDEGGLDDITVTWWITD